MANNKTPPPPPPQTGQPPGPITVEKPLAPSTPTGRERQERGPKEVLSQQPKKSTEIPVTVQYYLDNNILNAVVIDFDPKEVFNMIDNKVEELLESPEYEVQAKNLGITHVGIIAQLRAMKQIEEKQEESKEALEGVVEKKEKAEEAEVRGHRGFVEEKVRKETGAQEEERARVTEEIIDKAVYDVVSRRMRPEEEIVDRSSEMIEEMVGSGVWQTVEVIRETKREGMKAEVSEKRRIVGRVERNAEELVERIKQNENFLGEMDRVVEMAKDKGTTSEEICRRMKEIAEASPNPEIGALANRIEKPEVGAQEMIRIMVEEAKQKLRHLEQAKNALSEAEKEKVQKLGKDAAIEETRKRVQEQREKAQKDGKELGDLLREIKNLTKVGAQELQKKKDEILKEKPDLQREVAGKLIEDTSNILKKRISDSRKDEERIKRLEGESEKIRPEELKKRLGELFKEDRKTLEEIKKIKDNEIAEFARKKLKEKIEEGQGKRKEFEAIIKKLQEGTASTLKEINDRMKEKIKDPELLREVEERQAAGIVEYIEKKIKKLQQTEGILGAISQEMEKFSKKVDGAKQEIVNALKGFAKKQAVPEDAEAIEKINELEGLKGIEFARLHSKQKTEKLKGDAEYWKKKHKELAGCLEDPVLVKTFPDKVREMIKERPEIAKIIKKDTGQGEIVNYAKKFSDEKVRVLDEWLKTHSEVEKVSDDLYKKWDETAKFIDSIKSPIKIPKERIDWTTIERILNVSQKSIVACNEETKLWNSVLGQIRELKGKPEEFNRKLEEMLKDKPEELQRIRKLSADNAEKYVQDKIDETANPYLEMIKNFIGLYPALNSEKLIRELGYKSEEIESAEKIWREVESIAGSGKGKKEIVAELKKLAKRKDLPHRTKLKILNSLSHLGGQAGERRVNEIKKAFYVEKLVYEIICRKGFEKALANRDYDLVDEMSERMARMIDELSGLNTGMASIRRNLPDDDEKSKADRRKEIARLIARIYKNIMKLGGPTKTGKRKNN